MRFDVAVVGLGAMGSATILALSRRGVAAVGFDALSPPHALGSTHGHTRIIREAYYEHPLYVPLVQRAYELWLELERETDSRLLLVTGGVMVGPEHSPLVQGARASAEEHGIDHVMMDASALSQRFPAYRAAPDWVALYERRAGMLFPEKCVTAMLGRARTNGAVVQTNEEVIGWRPNGARLAVRTTRMTYDVDRVVVAAGPWLPRLADSLGLVLPLEVERQLSHWFEPGEDDRRYRARHCPIGLWDTANGDMFATLPNEGHGVKCGMHHAGQTTTPDAVERAVSHEENETARRLLDDVMPGAAGRLLDARVCLYTNTPDRHFLVDWVAGGRVLVLSPCSGHGFKFAPAIGEMAAELLADGRSAIDPAPFALSRFHRQ